MMATSVRWKPTIRRAIHGVRCLQCLCHAMGWRWGHRNQLHVISVMCSRLAPDGSFHREHDAFEFSPGP